MGTTLSDGAVALPLDLASAYADPQWRSHLFWPIPLAAHRSASKRPMQGLAELLSVTVGPERTVLLLAGGHVAALARQLLDVAIMLQAAAEQGAHVTSTSPYVTALRGDDEARCGIIALNAAAHDAVAPGRAGLRRMARMASWSSPIRLAKAVLNPDVLAISHNSLLLASAKTSKLAVGFDYAGAILARARQGGSVDDVHADELGHKLTHAVTSQTGVSADLLDGIRSILTPIAVNRLARAARDLTHLRNVRFPAKSIWSATGGIYASRAVGLAAMEQGLTVRRHEHVGTGCLVAHGLGFDLTERSVGSEVVVPTVDFLRFAENIRTAALEPLAKLIPGDGDPEFRFSMRAKPRPVRPNVVYATSFLRGYMQYHDPLLPDVVYLDWQMRVAEALETLPINVVLKPHPESIYPGNYNPLAAIASVSSEPFEKVIPQTDVFVFDFGQTTTFWKGLATAQPVVYLNLGISEFQPEVRAALAQRAVIVDVFYDERNRPIVDRTALADAIASAQPSGEDNLFRRWLGG